MSPPSAVHPVTGKHRDSYITLVLEQCEDSAAVFPIDDIANSMATGSESRTFPGYRIHDMSHGDYIATAIHASKEKTHE